VIGRPVELDTRSDMARGRDEWLESADGQSCLGPVILRKASDLQYLQNRLTSAWIAGAKWAEEQRKGSE
jgi:hypothetical protein